MDIKSKLGYVKTWVDTIARHDSVDVAIRNAALDAAEKHIAVARKGMADRVRAKIEEVAPADPAEDAAPQPAQAE